MVWKYWYRPLKSPLWSLREQWAEAARSGSSYRPSAALCWCGGSSWTLPVCPLSWETLTGETENTNQHQSFKKKLKTVEEHVVYDPDSATRSTTFIYGAERVGPWTVTAFFIRLIIGQRLWRTHQTRENIPQSLLSTLANGFKENGAKCFEIEPARDLWKF